MRTTVNIDNQLLARAKERARETGQTLGEVVEESLQALFTAPQAPAKAPDLPSFSGGGLMPGIDYSSNASMFDATEDDDELRRRAGLGG